MESGFDEVPVGPSQTEAIKDGRGPDDSVNGQASDFGRCCTVCSRLFINFYQIRIYHRWMILLRSLSMSTSGK